MLSSWTEFPGEISDFHDHGWQVSEGSALYEVSALSLLQGEETGFLPVAGSSPAGGHWLSLQGPVLGGDPNI